MRKYYIAVDLGAESGRVILGAVSAEKIYLELVHRFSNGPTKEIDSLRWDVEKLLSEIKTGIKKAIKLAETEVSGIGIDSWGVDFGLIDTDGKLIENPYNAFSLTLLFPILLQMQIDSNCGIDGRAVLMID